jgi:ComF family protein
MRRWLESVVSLAFPPACPSCGAPREDGGDALCPECARHWLAAAGAPFCTRCGHSVAAVGLDGALPSGCARCAERRPAYRPVVRVGAYEDRLRACVRRFKFHRDLAAGRLIGRLLAERAADVLAGRRIDAVVPMPMHWRRFLGRGLNPPRWLARWIGRAAGVPVRPWLRRRHHRPSQTQVAPTARRQNVRGVFDVPPRWRSAVAGARLCLADDVLTSGATAAEAARTLLAAGARAVLLAVAAVADRVEPDPS